MTIISLLAITMLSVINYMWFFLEPSLGFLLVLWVEVILCALGIITLKTVRKSNFFESTKIVVGVVLVLPLLPLVYEGAWTETFMNIGGILTSATIVLLIVMTVFVWSSPMKKIEEKLSD